MVVNDPDKVRLRTHFRILFREYSPRNNMTLLGYVCIPGFRCQWTRDLDRVNALLVP